MMARDTKKTVTNKEYLLGMYGALGNRFPLFKSMNTLVEKGNLSEDLMGKLSGMMRNSIKSIGNRIKSEKLGQSINKYNQTIRNFKSDEDLSSLDTQISTL